ncbi:alpha/beta hydrolase [archaeon]|jgi:pimeloyl-ACP methyl ester carboxylesterase|nr:alpha/beta hydrolase [archaeon]MBT4022168.1 alpha/beta hydrolase [archaeon]MBT4272781.1 alpha/beta hydrolase [archaeon]MBT4461580.1 alpha/beta hydrolase [archaeon]MBT5423228.1 alpha/beta hydrolase [archaeon]
MHKNKIVLNDKTYSYIDVGIGKEILLIPGWCDQSDDFLTLIKPLSKKNRLLVPDLPNFGDSKTNELFEEETHTKFLSDFLKKLEINDPIVIGHCYGGKLALQLSNQVSIPKIFLINSLGIKANFTWLEHVLLTLVNGVYEVTKDFALMSKVQSHWFKSMLKYGGKKDFWNYANKIIYTECENLDKIKSKVTILWAKNDIMLSNSYAKKLKFKIKNSKLIFMKGSHFSCIINPNIFARKIQSLMND